VLVKINTEPVIGKPTPVIYFVIELVYGMSRPNTNLTLVTVLQTSEPTMVVCTKNESYIVRKRENRFLWEECRIPFNGVPLNLFTLSDGSVMVLDMGGTLWRLDESMSWVRVYKCWTTCISACPVGTLGSMMVVMSREMYCIADIRANTSKSMTTPPCSHLWDNGLLFSCPHVLHAIGSKEKCLHHYASNPPYYTWEKRKPPPLWPLFNGERGSTPAGKPIIWATEEKGMPPVSMVYCSDDDEWHILGDRMPISSREHGVVGWVDAQDDKVKLGPSVVALPGPPIDTCGVDNGVAVAQALIDLGNPIELIDLVLHQIHYLIA
jgi:hypothetical protein